MLSLVLITAAKAARDYQSRRQENLVSHSDEKSLPSVVDETTFGRATEHHCSVSLGAWL
jgi:hypothetical protein